MARVNKALRERMQNRKKEMGRRGIVLDNKEWRKGRIRILPMREDQLEPGVEYLSFYCNELKRSTTAPSCLGAPDPLWEALENIYKTGTEDEKEHAKDYIKRSGEYWLAVVVRGDEGTALNPNIRVMRGKKTVYQEIADWLSNEDVGDDLTDADEGRDIFIRKEGEGINTEWKAQILDPSYLSDEDDLYAALVEAAEKFDVRNHFFKFDLEVYEQMYEGLTGEELPEEYREELEALSESRGVKRDDDEEEVEEDEDDAEEGAGYHDDEEADEEESEEDDAPEGVVFGETRVIFEGEDGEELEGTVMGWSAEEEGCCEVVTDDEPDEPWDVDPDEWEVLDSDEEEADDEEESDDEEEADDEEEESDDEAEASDPPEGVTFGETRVSFEGDGDSEGTVMAWDEDGKHVLVLEEGYESLDDAWSVHPDDYEIIEDVDDESDEEPEEPEEAPPRVRGGRKKTTTKKTAKKTTTRKPKGGAASKGIRGEAASKKTTKKATTRKKTTTRKPAAASKKKTTKKTTRKASASKASSKKTAKKTTARKPAAAGRRKRSK